MAASTYKKYNREDQRALATWAADCAERVLPLFEQAYPNDHRPRKAIEACRTWVSTGIFQMAVIRSASLSAHAAARAAKADNHDAACFAARAAGQAVATAHVTQHAYGSATYALKAIAAAEPAHAEANTHRERNWQSDQLPDHLRQEIMDRITIHTKGKRVQIKLRKDEGF